jgi:hypothetical protein
LTLLDQIKSNPTPTLPCFAEEGAIVPGGFVFVMGQGA